MFSRHSLLVASLLSVSLAALSGCAAPNDEEPTVDASESSITSAKEPGIEVVATYVDTFAEQPATYSTPTVPVVDIEVTVDDAALATRYAGFDGYERAFALIPRKVDGETRFERIELPFRNRSVRGYMNLRYVDVHGITGLRLSYDVLEDGIAVGLETNTGTIWAQAPGKNFTPTRKGTL